MKYVLILLSLAACASTPVPVVKPQPPTPQIQVKQPDMKKYTLHVEKANNLKDLRIVLELMLGTGTVVSFKEDSIKDHERYESMKHMLEEIKEVKK